MFTRSVVDMGLGQIQMVNYQVAGLQETLLGFGTIMMQTLVGDLVIHDVHHPAKTQKRILEILRSEGITAVSYDPNLEGDDPQSNQKQFDNATDEFLDEAKE